MTIMYALRTEMEAGTFMFKYFPVVTIGFMTQIPALALGQRKQLMIFVIIDFLTINNSF